MKIFFKIVGIVITITTMVVCSGKKGEKNTNNEANIDSRTTLWKDIKSGMSIEEVKNLYPSSEVIERKDLPDIFLVYQFNGVTIQKENFLVNFVFKDKILDVVSLIPKNELNKATSDIVAYGIEEELTQKYGKPVDKNSKNISMFGSENTTIWNDQGVIIQMIHVPSWAYNTGFIEIIYTSGTIAKEDNL